jgi:hypothetical protein
MRHLRITTLVVAGALVLAVPAALASPPTNPGANGNHTGQNNTNLPGPNASLPTKAKAYGVYCKTQSKVHVAGQKGTPFSQCVTAMAKAAHGTSPKAACVSLSRKHTAGKPGTPFSTCVAGAEKLQKDKNITP